VLEDDCVVVFTAPEETTAVGEAVSSALGLSIKTSDIFWDPNEDTKTTVSDDAAQDLAMFMDAMVESESTVHAISMNVAQGDLSIESWKELQARLS
jgi:transcriptional/translational regulatory protein YebC/TACO1